MVRDLQAERFAAAGAAGAEIDELLSYNESRFDLTSLAHPIPLDDEPFVACWARWAREARSHGAYAVLARHLPQLAFPIREGLSESEAYRAAVRRGVPVADLPEATGLEMERPERVELELYPSFAGRIPVVVVRGRPEFVALGRALAKKNEPFPIPDAQGAMMISGFNNWHRIHEHRRRWQALAPGERETATWGEEFARIRKRRELYQDRFILLSDGPYSGVPAAELGLDEAAWRDLSLIIRREHECSHYLTRRLFGSMRNHVLDELIADYTGLVAALGRVPAAWFLRFVGLEHEDRYRAGARLDIYRGDPPLSDGAFRVLQTILRRAATHLEAFDAGHWPAGPRDPFDRALMIVALACLRLDELAADDAGERLAAAVARCETRLERRRGA